MTSQSLTKNDLFVLEKIKDPEYGLADVPLINKELPPDPHIAEPTLYREVVQQERDIISAIQSTELRGNGLETQTQTSSLLAQYMDHLKALSDLIEVYPRYSSLRNNRAQALRRIYGADLLVSSGRGVNLDALDPSASEETLAKAAITALDDLTIACSLLTPKSKFSAISPQAAKTLSLARTQRGALYHLTAKRLGSKGAKVRVQGREEADWSSMEFEEAASNDFLVGARYGNDVAKGLAVSTNPTAKLCGEMVKEAMKQDFAG